MSDDYSHIMYKILAYFYTCLREGKRPRAEDIGCECEMFSIPQSYWNSIMEDMVNDGFLKNVFVIDTRDGIGIKLDPSAAITRQGVDFLESNSRMAEAKKILGRGFEILLAGIISRR